MTRPARRLLAAAAALALCGGAAAAPATAAPKRPAARAPTSVRHQDFTVDVTGSHVVDWQFRSRHFGDYETGWDEGRGRQRLNWDFRTPLRVRLLHFPAVPGHLPAGTTLMHLDRTSVVGVVHRTMRAMEFPGKPASEGCDIVGCEAPPPRPITGSCPRRKADLHLSVNADKRGALDVRPVLQGDVRYADCWPTTLISGLEHHKPHLPRIRRAVQRMGAMKVDEQIRLVQRDDEAGTCPLPDPPNPNGDIEECAFTYTIVLIRRTR
jgi:hypothetical protein